MLKKQESFIDTKNNSQDTQDEELYQRLFKKIARDFIYIGDLEALLDGFYDELQQAQKEKRTLSRMEMQQFAFKSILKAMEYKDNLSKPKHKRKKYKDVNDG